MGGGGEVTNPSVSVWGKNLLFGKIFTENYENERNWTERGRRLFIFVVTITHAPNTTKVCVVWAVPIGKAIKSKPVGEGASLAPLGFSPMVYTKCGFSKTAQNCKEMRNILTPHPK